jgi:hypothetical protein
MTSGLFVFFGITFGGSMSVAGFEKIFWNFLVETVSAKLLTFQKLKTKNLKNNFYDCCKNAKKLTFC